MVGRRPERARLTALLDAAREGRSGTLLLHGPPGIGKTELLRFAIASADGFRVLRARGMETESDIPFAGLAELVTPLRRPAGRAPGGAGRRAAGRAGARAADGRRSLHGARGAAVAAARSTSSPSSP